MPFSPITGPGSKGSSPVGPQQPIEKDEVKTEIEKAVNETAKQNLAPPSPSPSTGWNIWSWLPWGSKAAPSTQQANVEGREEGLSQETAENEEEGLEGETEPFQSSLTDEEKDFFASFNFEVAGNTTASSEKKKEQLTETVVKTEQAAKKSWWSVGGAWNGVKSVVSSGAQVLSNQVTRGIQAGVSYIDIKDKERVIAQAKQEMLDNLDDPQFVECYEMIKVLLSRQVESKLADVKQGFVATNLLPQRDLILALLEMNLARGFVNLSSQIKQNQNNIPNYDQQPSLVSALSLLCQKVGTHVDAKLFADIEQKYRQDRADFTALTKKLFPHIESDPAKQKLIKEFVQATNEDKKIKIYSELFPHAEERTEDKAKEIQEFRSTAHALRQRHQELQNVFTQVSDDILIYLFPNKLSDIQFPVNAQMAQWGWVKNVTGWVQNLIYDHLIKTTLRDLLQDVYEPLENDAGRIQNWNDALQKRIGVTDVKPMVQAPTSLLVAFTKNYIQSDPRVVGLTARALDSVIHASVDLPQAKQEQIRKDLSPHFPADRLAKFSSAQLERLNQLSPQQVTKLVPLKAEEFDKQLIKEVLLAHFTEAQLVKLSIEQLEKLVKLTPLDREAFAKLSTNEFEQRLAQDILLPQLAQEQLANWIVESTQVMLHTEDPALLGFGHFIQQTMNQLTLAMMAKGAQLVIPEGTKIEDHQFLKELTDRIVQKFQSLQGQEVIPDEFWKEFVQDLPLPQLLKELMVPILIEKAKSLQTQFKEKAPDLQEIQKVYTDSEKTILGYEGGKELLSITEKVSDQIIEQVLERNIGLVSTLGVGDTIEEMFAQYLPDVKFDDNLKKWFKENISALGTTQKGQSPQSIVLLKQGIRAVMRKALVNTIETNFKNNGKDYAAQLLQNLRQAFVKAFANFTPAQKAEIQQALAIQSEIEMRQQRIDAIKAEHAAKPQGITSEQMALLQEIINADIRYTRASNYVVSLQEKRSEILDRLNQGYADKPWTVKKLPALTQALVLYKTHTSPQALIVLKNQAANLRVQVRLATPQEKPRIQEALDQHETLLMLLDMLPEELALVSEFINTDMTVQHADKELQHLKTDLRAKEQDLEQYDLGKIDNRAEWDQATAWIVQVLESRQEMNDLSQEVAVLEKDLLTHLKAFQNLVHELMGLIGLDQKEKLKLPSFLQDKIWPLIEKAENQTLAPVFFKQLTPLFLPLLEMQKNRDKLNQLTKNDPFLAQVVKVAAEETLSRLPEFITSYKPFAEQILAIMGVKNPTEKEIARMETSLQHTMMGLGKEGIVASMLQPFVKGVVTPNREQSVSEALSKWITEEKGVEFSKDQILKVLKKELKLTSQEEAQIDKSAQALTRSINQFLLDRGKSRLHAKELLEAYQEQVAGTQTKIAADQIKDVLKKLQTDALVDKIKIVAITPEEIAHILNDVIPGAKDLHRLIAPQLQEVIVGNNATFKANRELLQQYIEGLLLTVFVKIAETNQQKNQEILVVLTGKLQALPAHAERIQGKNKEEVAREMIDEVLKDVLGIASQEDLPGVPLPLKKMVYDKLKEIAYQQATPLMLPIIERVQNRTKLHAVSGSKFLGNLSEALSKDIFYLLPAGVKSYAPLAQEMYAQLAGQPATPAQANEFATEIVELVKASKEKNVTHKALVHAYAKVAKIQLTSEQQLALEAKLDQSHAKDKIRNIVMSPEEIAALIGEVLPRVDTGLQKTLADELQNLIQNNPAVYQNGSEFAQTYVDGMLLRILIKIAEKNPAKNGKDTLIVLTEKLLDLATKKYQEAKTRPFEEVAQELTDSLMKDVLGIDSAEALEGLPAPVKAKVYETIKDKFKGIILSVQKGLKTLEATKGQVQQAKEESKKFGIQKDAAKGYAQILSEDMAALVLNVVPDVLTEKSGEKTRGVNTISKGIEEYLEELARGNLEVAKVLLNYTKAPQFQEMLGENIAKLADQTQLLDDKKKAADLLGNLILVPLNQVLEKAVKFEEEKGAEATQKLMANVLHVAAEHLKTLNAAKELASLEGREISQQDFINAAGANLHPGVPKGPVTYQQSIDLVSRKIYGLLSPEQQKASGKTYGKLTPEQEKIWLQEQTHLRQAIAQLVKQEGQGTIVLSNHALIAEIKKIHLKVMNAPLTRTQQAALQAPNAEGFTLKDIIRQETEAPHLQRKKEFYTPAVKSVLKLVFPNGKNDLTFVPEELRGQTWKMFKKNLFPVVLPMITELLLEPDTINKIVLSSLETARDSLKGDIVVEETREPADRPLDALDDASGELIVEMLKAVKLPEWVKNQIVDPKTGETSATMKKALGATLRKQFNSTFVKDKLQTALEKVVQRDDKGNYMLNVKTGVSKQAKEAAAVEDRAKMKVDLQRVTHEVVDVSISFFIRNKWVHAQDRFDKLVDKAFPRIGIKLKRALDAIFGFIFFKIVGTILAVLFSPIKGWTKQKLYDFLSLDENRDMLLKLFEQGKEDLVFKMGHEVKRTLEEILEEPALPGSPEVTPRAVGA